MARDLGVFNKRDYLSQKIPKEHERNRNAVRFFKLYFRVANQIKKVDLPPELSKNRWKKRTTRSSATELNSRKTSLSHSAQSTAHSPQSLA